LPVEVTDHTGSRHDSTRGSFVNGRKYRARPATHSLRRTKAVLIYRRTGNLRAVQLLLGHSKIESTVRYLGIEVDDAIEIAEKIDI
jgi:integrase